MVNLDLRRQIGAVCRGERPWPITLFGLPGRGKSTAAMLLLDCVGHGMYVTARECVNNEFGTGESPADRFRYEWKRADLCVIDQFGMDCRPGSACPPGKLQVFVDLIDYREGKPLILVSNHPPATLGELFDAQIRDRIEGGTILELCGPSYRANR
jgi:DNA replication protein DnaC